MSMNSNPNSGYVMPVTKLRPLIQEDYLEEFDEMIKDQETDEEIWMSFFEDVLFDVSMPTPGGFFVLHEEDYSESLEIGVLYAIFDEEDMFMKQLRPEMLHLSVIVGELPEIQHWTKFG